MKLEQGGFHPNAKKPEDMTPEELIEWEAKRKEALGEHSTDEAKVVEFPDGTIGTPDSSDIEQTREEYNDNLKRA
jgi:hypothetical protein